MYGCKKYIKNVQRPPPSYTHTYIYNLENFWCCSEQHHRVCRTKFGHTEEIKNFIAELHKKQLLIHSS